MEHGVTRKISWPDRYLVLWIFTAMATRIGIGYLVPGVEALRRLFNGSAAGSKGETA